jgi:ribonuclease HI
MDMILQQMQRAIDKSVNWAKDCGLTFSAKKTEILLLKGRKKLKPPHKLNMYGQPIEFVKSVKYLGVTIDDKLNFNQHILRVTARAKGQLLVAGNALKRKFGPLPKPTQWLYEGAILPALTYAAFIWYKGITNKHRAKLCTLQRMGLSLMGNFRRATPNLSLEILFNVPPLDLKIEEIAMKTCLRLQPAAWTAKSPYFRGHIETLKLKMDGLFNASLDSITPCLVWRQNYNVTIGDGTDPPTDSYDWRGYSDGSLMEGKAAAGAAIFKGDRWAERLGCHLGENVTVYQAELIGIQLVVSYLLEQEATGNICILVDNQASLKSLKSIDTSVKTVMETKLLLNELGTRAENITLQYIKAHNDIRGNELADRIAKEYSQHDTAILTDAEKRLNLPWAKKIIHGKIKAITTTKWESRWDLREDCREAKYFLRGPDPRFLRALRTLSRDNIGLVVHHVTGHSRLLRRNAIVDERGPDYTANVLCRLCGDEDETSDHLIGRCGALNSARLRAFDQYQLPEFYNEWDVGQMVNFLQDPRITELERVGDDPFN